MKQQWLGYLMACVTLAVASLAASASETIGHAEVSFSGGVEEQFSGSAMYLTQELPTGDRLVLTLYRYESDDDLTAISMVFPADTAKAENADHGPQDQGTPATAADGGKNVVSLDQFRKK